MFSIKDICFNNIYMHYSTFVPPCKTLTLNMCTTSASLARRITPAALQLSASARFLWFCYFCVSATAKISTGSQFISVPKKIKKDPVKGLGIAVTKVLIAACSASTLAQRIGCYFHLHRVYTINGITLLIRHLNIRLICIHYD